ncbi:MAG: beta-ketoacyl-ACP synthase 3 [Spirochaeta sp.]
MDRERLMQLYRWMVTAREMDLLEQSFTGRGEAFFHVSGAGHEGFAALQLYLKPEDYLHCHYRDKALMLARGISPEMFFLSLFTKDGSHSRGRQMNAHMSAPELNVLSLVGPDGNSPLQAVGVAAAIREQKERPIVLCSLGDGMTQQGEVLEGIAHAVRDELPVLFLVQDNTYAISTRTDGRTFYDLPDGPADSFYGMEVVRVDGRDAVGLAGVLEPVVAGMREDRRPRLVVAKVDRLHNHTNADDQRVYRSAEDIQRVTMEGDPLVRLVQQLEEMGESHEGLQKIAEGIRAELVETAKRAQRGSEPEPVMDAMAPLPAEVGPGAVEYRGQDGRELPDAERRTMLEAIRDVLRNNLAADERVHLFGEDIEDPKGDVFGVTKGLSQSFPGRVENSPLAEATILGVSIGRALAGQLPVAFLQFADFLPIAYNQIVSELGSMYWRTDGGWQCPVIVMITCGGYRPGLGPFHASSFEALAMHTPGVDVCMPSTAGDAAGMLNAAFKSGRPTLFFYPKNCLNSRDDSTSLDIDKHLIPVGSARTVRSGSDLTFVGYGNTVGLSLKAAAVLEEQGVSCEVIDLRYLMPWDVQRVAASVEKTGRLLVSHEDNRSAGVGAEIAATVAEMVARPVSVRRVTRPDTFVPCNFGNQLSVLPSYQRILESAVDMLGGEIRWVAPAAAGAGEYLIEAIGSSPSDEAVTVLEWKIEPGQRIASGDLIAELEADKASFDLKSPVDGEVSELLVQVGDTVSVGTPLVKVGTGVNTGDAPLKPITRENPGEPVISGIRLERSAGGGAAASSAAVSGGVGIGTSAASAEGAASGGAGVGATAGIIVIAGAAGSRIVSNEEIAAQCSELTPADIVKKTGIRQRSWIGEGEDCVVLAERAAREALEQAGLDIQDIDLIVCATGSPMYHTPTVAAMVQARLADGMDELLVPAVDLNAACSGYLFGLQYAGDYLHRRPHHRVLMLTSEVLSPQIDRKDPATAPIFGDAATATILTGLVHAQGWRYSVDSVELSAEGETGDILKVPADSSEKIFMDGPQVFVKAVSMMMRMLRQACQSAGVDPNQLDLIVPHQANQRIINAVRQRMKAPEEKMFSNIARYGNTSSCTIPLALIDAEAQGVLKGGKRSDAVAGGAGSAGKDGAAAGNAAAASAAGKTIGLTAFGGGFTFGGAVLTER